MCKNKSLIVWILIGLSAATLCSVANMAAEYIDATLLDESDELFQNTLEEFINEYGSENPEETAKVLRELVEYLENAKSNWASFDGTKFKVKSKLAYNPVKARGYYFFVRAISGLIDDTETHFDRANLSRFLGMIKRFFGSDLVRFADEKLASANKLQAFLFHYGKVILSRALKISIPVRSQSAENSMEKLIAHDLGPNYTERDLLSAARRLNLVSGVFNGRSMLANINKSSANKFKSDIFKRSKGRLAQKLKQVCDEFSLAHGLRMEVYTWARLVIPEQLTSEPENLPKLLEYWRICLPVMNPIQYVTVVQNVSRNSRFVSSIGR